MVPVSVSKVLCDRESAVKRALAPPRSRAAGTKWQHQGSGRTWFLLSSGRPGPEPTAAYRLLATCRGWWSR